MPINPYIKPPKKDNNDWGTALSLVGIAGGALQGALTADPNPLTGEVTTKEILKGGMKGIAEGSQVAGAFRPLVPDNSKPAEASPTIENDAMSRRMSVLQKNLEDDPYQGLRHAALALPNLPADQRASAAEPILRALQMGARGTRV